MSEYKMPNQIDNGVKTPEVTGLNNLSFDSGYKIKTALSSTHAIVSNLLSFSIANAATISGRFFVNVICGTASANVVLDVSASSFSNKQNSVEVASCTSSKDTLTFKAAYLFKKSDNSELAIKLVFDTTETVPADVKVTSISDALPNITKNAGLSAWPIEAQYFYNDSRGLVNGYVKVLNGVSLNDMKTPMMATLSAALDVPPNSATNGVLTVLGSALEGVLTQVFMDTAGKSFMRVSDASRNWGNTWTQVLDSTATAGILNTANNNALIWAIIMG